MNEDSPLSVTVTLSDDTETSAVEPIEFFNAVENIENKPGFEKISATLITNCKKRIAEVKAEMEKTNRTLRSLINSLTMNT